MPASLDDAEANVSCFTQSVLSLVLTWWRHRETLTLVTGPCGRGHLVLALALLTIIKSDSEKGQGQVTAVTGACAL